MTLKCATFNTNSIRARLPIITGWLARERPDILCIQETKVQDKDFPVEPFEAAGYGAAFRGQKSYNGVAILSRLPLEGVRTELYAEGDPQARFISASVGGISVVNAYVPQGSEVGTDKFAYKLTWLSDLLAHLKETYPQDAPVIVAGDFNVALEDRDVFDPEGFRGEVAFHPDEQAILREFMAWGLVDVFRSHVPEGGALYLLGLPHSQCPQAKDGVAHRLHPGHGPPRVEGRLRRYRHGREAPAETLGPHVSHGGVRGGGEWLP